MSDASPDDVVPLLAPRDGVPPVVTTGPQLAAVVTAFAAGTGPVAVDVERASGYRYSQRAYLVQLRRDGAGTALIDPIACADLSPLGRSIADAEWVLHAANQDLPSLADVGLRPTRIFDTELAGRLAGHARVGLATMVENVLGYALEKGHSAADWSQRPLPEPLVRYAALDVEVLIQLRDALCAELDAQGKLEWARQEFAAIVAAAPPQPRAEPWRRSSGIHRLRTRRQLAAVRALWQTRDEIARQRDVAPSRVLPDSAMISIAAARPRSRAELARLSAVAGRGARRYLDRWFTALSAAESLADGELPEPLPTPDGPPPAQRWADRDPAAAERLVRARAAVRAVADPLRVPVENLLAPDVVRRLAWSPPDPPTAESVARALRADGARPWQVELAADALAAALAGVPSSR